MRDLLDRLNEQGEYESDGHGSLHKEAAAEIVKLRAALQPFADAYAAVERETQRLTRVNPKYDWQFASEGYRKVLADSIAPTWFRDAAKLLSET